MQSKKIYSVTSDWVNDIIRRCVDRNFNAIQLQEGSLALGEWVVYNDDDPTAYIFHIWETYLNEWSSDMLAVRYMPGKMPKRLRKRIDEYVNAHEDERNEDGQIVSGEMHWDNERGMVYGW